jgi:hypothetical protein
VEQGYYLLYKNLEVNYNDIDFDFVLEYIEVVSVVD